MSAVLYTCAKCKCAYVGNGRMRYCVHCGEKLTDQGVVAEGFGRRELEEYRAKGWAIFMAKMEGD